MPGREVVIRLKTPSGDVRDIRGHVVTGDPQYTLELEIPNLGLPGLMVPTNSNAYCVPESSLSLRAFGFWLMGRGGMFGLQEWRAIWAAADRPTCCSLVNLDDLNSWISLNLPTRAK